MVRITMHLDFVKCMDVGVALGFGLRDMVNAISRSPYFTYCFHSGSQILDLNLIH